MERVCFAPGPTELHPLVGPAMREAVESRLLSHTHRSERFAELYRAVKGPLRRMLGIPERSRIFFTGSATEAMERTVQNTVLSSSYHFVNGSFSERFYLTSQELGRSATALVRPDGEGFWVDQFEVPAGTELVCVTQNETSTGCSVPEESIHDLKRANPDVLLAVDVVSSCPYAHLDFDLVDVAFWSVQKCFGLPAGLGVMVVHERAMEKAREMAGKGVSTGTYHSFASLGKWEAEDQTPETPNVLGIYLLGRVLSAFEEVGIEALRRETEEKAGVIYDAVAVCERLSCFVGEEAFRSRTVAAVEFEGDAFWLRSELEKRGFEVGAGYKEKKKTQSRIANFPMHTRGQIERLMGAMVELASG